MSEPQSTVTVDLVQQADFRFEARYGGKVPSVVVDEPPPLGGDAGPNPARLLVTAVADCLSASLLFAMRKFKNEPGPISTRGTGTVARNAQNRLRITGIAVEIRMGVPAAELKMADRILEQFEDFCIVTQSVRGGIPVEVTVTDGAGAKLWPRG